MKNVDQNTFLEINLKSLGENYVKIKKKVVKRVHKMIFILLCLLFIYLILYSFVVSFYLAFIPVNTEGLGKTKSK